MPTIVDGTTGVDQIQNGTVTEAKIANGAVTDAKIAAMAATKLTGNVAAARITTALNATGSAPIYACRAWVNFNGTNTVAIRASGNVSSITDNGTGDYTVNFTTAMPDANYNAVFGVLGTAASGRVIMEQHDSPLRSTTQLRIYTLVPNSGALADSPVVSVSIFR